MAGKIENFRIQVIIILSIHHLRLFCSLYMQHANVCKYGHKCTCEYTHIEIDTHTHTYTQSSLFSQKYHSCLTLSFSM